MTIMIKTTLKLAEAGRGLSMAQMSETMSQIMEGRAEDDQIARLLIALHNKGETVAEIAGAASVMRRHMTPIRTDRTDLVDVVGTGGDASGTFNISTAAALVTAAAGVPVAKHGNRAVTSRSGSSDVLAVLGVNVEANLDCVESCLNELGICFCYAPLHHKAMRHVAAVRRNIPHPTIFNILGPLCNPAGAQLQLIGTGRSKLRPLLAEALAMLGIRRALVVHGTDGLDEVSLGATTDVTEVLGIQLSEFSWTAEDFGLTPAGIETMQVDGPEQSARLIREILDGHPGPPRDIVVANAAAALWTAGRAESLLDCTQAAAEAIDSGAARALLIRLAERTVAG